MARLIGCLAILTLVAHASYGSGYPCPTGYFYELATDKCYKVVNIQTDWMTARQHCMSEDADLIEFETEDDIPRIIKYPAIVPDRKYFWTGLNDRNVAGVYRWNNKEENATYFKWGQNYPSTRSDYRFDCVAMIKIKEVIEWENRVCSRAMYFICQRLTNENLEAYKTEHKAELDVTCPDGWERIPNRRKCVKVFDELADYNTAMHHCHAIKPGKTNLLDIPDFEVNDYFIEKLGKGFWWIAPTDQQHEGVFTATTLPGSKRVTYLPWKKGARRSPTNNCVWLASDGKKGIENRFWDVQCHVKRTYICQYEPEPVPSAEKVCPRGWKKFAPSETCFKVESEITGTWTRARRECKKIGGDLATIPDQKTRDFVKGIISDDRYWIGLVDVKNTGTFAWVGKDVEVDQRELDTLAGKDLGTKDCVEIIGSRGGVWKDRNCNAKRNFICEKEATLPDEG